MGNPSGCSETPQGDGQLETKTGSSSVSKTQVHNSRNGGEAASQVLAKPLP